MDKKRALVSFCIWLIITTIENSAIKIKGSEINNEIGTAEFTNNLARNKRELDTANEFSDPSDFLKVLKFSNAYLDVQINPLISEADSDSVTVGWTANVNATKANMSSKMGLKLSYRPFGSIKEREITLMTEAIDYSESYEIENDYVIDHLIPNTGYVFCFSILISHEEHKIVDEDFSLTHFKDDVIISTEKEEEEQVVFFNNFQDTRHLPTEEEEEPQVFINNFQATRNLPSEGEDQVFPGRAIHRPPSLNLPRRGFINQAPRLNFNAAQRSHSHPWLGHPSIKSSSNNQNTVPKQDNYAYTSTGELIYLPSTQWNPHERRKRFTTFEKDTHGLEMQEKFCQEIVTKFRFSSLINPLNILIFSISFVGIIVLFLFMIYIIRNSLYCCSKTVCCCPNKEKAFQNGNDSTTENNFSEISRVKTQSSCNEVVKRQDITTLRFQPKIPCKYIKEPKIQVPATKSLDTEFHPGYEIPPSSTFAVYGYDFPKALNKYSETSGSPSTSSGDLNDLSTEPSWNAVSDKYNLDLPRKRSKKSEVSKFYGGKEQKSQKYRTIHSLQARKMINEMEFLSTETHISVSSNPPSYDAFEKSERLTEAIEDKVIGDVERLTKIQSIGDVTVTGGTLIEVPEGYVIPPKHSLPTTSLMQAEVLRILVGGEPSYV